MLDLAQEDQSNLQRCSKLAYLLNKTIKSDLNYKKRIPQYMCKQWHAAYDVVCADTWANIEQQQSLQHDGISRSGF